MVLTATQLCKHFADITAVDHIDLDIRRGEIFGLLGPNAAGKSTTLRILAGILTPDSGKANVLGYDLQTQAESLKEHIGYVAQFFALYPELTVAENLRFYCDIYRGDGDRQRKLLDSFGMLAYRQRRAATLSGGFKRRLSIICALCHDPALVFLDEPTAGIDPVTRKELWEQFYRLSSEGKTLFLTTHYMEEAQRCHRLAFLHQGRIVACGTPADIIHGLKDYTIYSCHIRYQPALAAALRQLPEVRMLNQIGDQLRIITGHTTPVSVVDAVLQQYLPAGYHIEQKSPDLEDAFMLLTQETPP